MGFSMKDEEFFEKYIAQQTKKGHAADAREVVADMFASVNTQELTPDEAIKIYTDKLLPYLQESAHDHVKNEISHVMHLWRR